MTDSCAKREQNPHYGLYNGLRNGGFTAAILAAISDGTLIATSKL